MSPVPPGIVIRSEAPEDAPSIRSLTDAAFAPSTVEGRIVDALRDDTAAWIPDLSIVAADDLDGGRIVGHCVTTIGSLHARGDAADVSPILGLGPISVAPERQGERIGTALIHARFGFESARGIGIEPPEPWSDEHWMALRLPAWRPGREGTMRYPAAFDID